MVNIYCSRRLELFLREPPELPAERNDPESILGDWNAYTIRLSAKQFVLFVNSKTCYCLPVIFDRQIPDIELWFEEMLLRQLNEDFKLSKAVEESIRHELAQIRICQSNNNRRVNGMVRDIFVNLNFYLNELNSFAPFDEICIAIFLNGRPIESKAWARGDKHYCANDGMKRLIEIYAKTFA